MKDDAHAQRPAPDPTVDEMIAEVVRAAGELGARSERGLKTDEAHERTNHAVLDLWRAIRARRPAGPATPVSVRERIEAIRAEVLSKPSCWPWNAIEIVRILDEGKS